MSVYRQNQRPPDEDQTPPGWLGCMLLTMFVVSAAVVALVIWAWAC